MDDDDLFDALRRAMLECQTASLERSYALPSPLPTTLADVTTNAIFISGTGQTRQMSVADFRHEYLFPVRQMTTGWRLNDSQIQFDRPPIASFLLSTIQNGIAVYRYAGTR